MPACDDVIARGGFHIWMPACDDVIARNIFVTDKPYQFIRANPAYAKEFDYNLFFCEKGRPTITGVGKPMSLEQWQQKGFDTHSIFADPMFVASENGDYRVMPDSPALELGFKNFPMDQFGVRKPPFQREAAREPRRFKPALTQPAAGSARSAARSAWLGATVKNLTGEAEKSAPAGVPGRGCAPEDRRQSGGFRCRPASAGERAQRRNRLGHRVQRGRKGTEDGVGVVPHFADSATMREEIPSSLRFSQ